MLPTNSNSSHHYDGWKNRSNVLLALKTYFKVISTQKNFISTLWIPTNNPSNYKTQNQTILVLSLSIYICFFPSNIEILKHNHQTYFIAWNLWKSKNSILMVENNLNDDFISHHQNLRTLFSFFFLTRIERFGLKGSKLYKWSFI